MKSQKPYLRYYNLLRVQNFCRAHYQFQSIILQKEFVKLNVKTGSIKKIVKLADFKTKIVTAFLNLQTLKMI